MTNSERQPPAGDGHCLLVDLEGNVLVYVPTVQGAYLLTTVDEPTQGKWLTVRVELLVPWVTANMEVDPVLLADWIDAITNTRPGRSDAKH